MTFRYVTRTCINGGVVTGTGSVTPRLHRWGRQTTHTLTLSQRATPRKQRGKRQLTVHPNTKHFWRSFSQDLELIIVQKKH